MNTILITGGAAGIGLATAQLFDRQGWSIGLLDREAQALKQAQATLGRTPWTCAVDVCDEQAVTAAVRDFATQHGGNLQVLFNNAGILRIGEFEQISLAEHRAIIDVNVTGIIHLCHAAFPYLKNTPGAQVINMSSASALYGTPHLASYSASKFAVRGLTEALQLEWAAHDIRVADIMPPFVNTHMVQSQSFQAPALKRLGVKLSAQDVAQAVWRSVGSDAVHHPVGASFKAAMLTNKLLPAKATQKLMALLSR